MSQRKLFCRQGREMPEELRARVL